MDGNDVTKAVQRANAELLMVQSYDVTESNTKKRGKQKFDVSSLYELKTERGVVAEVVEGLRPTDVRASKSGKKKKVSLRFACLCPEELEVLSELGIEKALKYKCLFAKKGESKGREYVLKAERDGSFTFTPSSIKAGTAYGARVKVVLEDRESGWSDEAELTEEEGAETGACEPGAEKLNGKRERIRRTLNERIKAHEESRKAAQDKLYLLCEGLRARVGVLKSRVNKALEEKFPAEDRRLQNALNELRTADGSNVPKMLQRAKAELLVVQSYEVVEHNVKGEDQEPAKKKARIENGDGGKGVFDVGSLCELKTEKRVSPGMMEEKKAANLVPSFTEKGDLSVSFEFFNEDEVETMKDIDSPF